MAITLKHTRPVTDEELLDRGTGGIMLSNSRAGTLGRNRAGGGVGGQTVHEAPELAAVCRIRSEAVS